MTLLVLGLSHRSAPADLLDAAAVPADLHAKALASVLQRQHVREAVVLSTCNRLEVYAEVSRYHGGVADLRDHLAEWTGRPLEEIAQHAFDRFDTSAAEHLFAVASGLDSMVVGERQIHGQVRQAFRHAIDEGTAGPVLNRVFRQAVRVGRRVRQETAISAGGATIVDLALAAAAQARTDAVAGSAAHAAAPLPPPVVALVGAGKIGGMVAQRVADSADRLLVTNRSAHRAEGLAARTGGVAHALEELPLVLAAADVVVTSTDAPQPLITAEAVAAAMAARPHRPLVLVDLAVPRDVEPAAGEVPGVSLIDIQSLRQVATRGPAGGSVAAARTIVAEEAAGFAAWSRGVQAGPAIAALRSRAEDVRQAELRRLGGRLASLDPGQRDAVEALTRGIVNTLLHEPSVRLKGLVDAPDGERYVRAIAHLFDLSVAVDAELDDPSA